MEYAYSFHQRVTSEPIHYICGRCIIWGLPNSRQGVACYPSVDFMRPEGVCFHPHVVCVWLLDGVWIGEWIYWQLTDVKTTSNFNAVGNSCNHLTTSHTSFFFCCVLTSRCLVVTSNGGRSPYSAFPNYIRVSATRFNSNSSEGLNHSSPLIHSLSNSNALY
jgi:hypothetical protein